MAQQSQVIFYVSELRGQGAMLHGPAFDLWLSSENYESQACPSTGATPSQLLSITKSMF